MPTDIPEPEALLQQQFESLPAQMRERLQVLAANVLRALRRCREGSVEQTPPVRQKRQRDLI